MPIEIKMPALSPTMEEGTLARWLVAEGTRVEPGDILAEIETDKATMEYEAAEGGVISAILVLEGTYDVKVGTVIATLTDAPEAVPARRRPDPIALARSEPKPRPEPTPDAATTPTAAHDRVSPLARRLAEQRGIDLAALTGTGPGGLIVKSDIVGTRSRPEQLLNSSEPDAPSSVTVPALSVLADAIPSEIVALSSMRRTIARRLTQSKQQIPHIYLSVDVRLDALLSLRAELNAALATRGIKLSVNDMLIKALAAALIEVPSCNVSFVGDALVKYHRADIAVAVSVEGGLVAPIVRRAESKSLAAVGAEMALLAARARDGALAPQDYEGGTASLSNMGMYGIGQFAAIINPPHATIMAVGAGEQRPIVVDYSVAVASVMTCTGSFDHRAVDGADAAQLMQVFRALVESPLLLAV